MTVVNETREALGDLNIGMEKGSENRDIGALEN